MDFVLWASQRKENQGQTVYLNCLVWEVATPLPSPSLNKILDLPAQFKPCSALLTSSVNTRLLVFAKLFLACLFIQSDDFTHDVFTLYGRVEAFAGVALLSHRQVLLGFAHAASEDGVGACNR